MIDIPSDDVFFLYLSLLRVRRNNNNTIELWLRIHINNITLFFFLVADGGIQACTPKDVQFRSPKESILGSNPREGKKSRRESALIYLENRVISNSDI